MTKRIFYIITLWGLLTGGSLIAQDKKQKMWNSEKIKGTQFIAYPTYAGTPYLSEKFVIGDIELTDGTTIRELGLRYSSFQDELIYYNKFISKQIVIDKISLKGFSFDNGNGVKRIFRSQDYDINSHEQRFFEVLSEGTTSLLAYRKVDLESCETSYSKFGLAYQPSYRYYLYSAEKGYSTVKLTRNSLLSKFDKPNQKIIKRILRKNGVQITDEASFVKAWDLVSESGIKLL